jgi:rubrerythrin
LSRRGPIIRLVGLDCTGSPFGAINCRKGRIMAVNFNADEILAVAVNIEVNGINFYQSAAAAVPDGRPRQLLLDLAGRERVHEKTFTEMRGKLSARQREQVTFDPDNESSLYLKALADSTVFKQQADPLKVLGKSPTYKAILLAAMGIEKESIVFYVGMRDFIPVSLGRSQVDAILREEMTHLTTLGKELAAIKD